jgi:uncharacterized protein
MGHRHSPAEFGGERGIFRAHGRVAAAAADRCEGVAASDSELSGALPRAHSAGVRAALFLLRAYQAFLSPLMIGSCRFYPSCSRYAYEAIEVHGMPRGIWMGMKRLLRCHPFTPGGFDPVPANKGTQK